MAALDDIPEDAAPLDLMRRAGAFYECPKDAAGRRLGPLVGYAGRDADDRQYVGDIYVNFAKAESRPRLLAVFSRQLAALLRRAGHRPGRRHGVLRRPGGRQGLRVSARPRSGRSYIYPEKTITAAASATSRETSELVFSRHEPEPGQSWFIVEDVCNNFSTTAKLVALIESHGARVAGILCFLNRSATIDGSFEPRPGQACPWWPWCASRSSNMRSTMLRWRPTSRAERSLEPEERSGPGWPPRWSGA